MARRCCCCSCLYANLCMHSAQDLNRLTCFRNFWNRGIRRSFFWWSVKNEFVL